jgi:FkbM family methyltransferase
MKIYRIKWLRSWIIPLLKRLNPGTVSIKHHYTGDRFSLDAFKHKGYWYHGKNREKGTIDLFRQIIQPGDTVVEVGGHIGYMSLIYSQQVGNNGQVIVFEPGTNNLPYIKRNIDNSGRKNISIIEAAISNADGYTTFYMEDLTGQNNSLLHDYEHTQINAKNAGVAAKSTPIEVKTWKLDTYLTEKNIQPAFIKIDIEGAEWMALEGMQNTLRNNPPVMMIEVTAENEKVFDFLTSFGYQLFDEDRQPVVKNSGHWSNTFCLHASRHQQLIQQLFMAQ